jgi:hypothetical protein
VAYAAVMPLSAKERDYIVATPSAAMITVGADTYAKAVRVAVGFLDDRLVSSGVRDRVRTARLRADPRCTLYVHDGGYGHLVLETTVTIDDGDAVAADTLRFFRQLQSTPTGPLTWFGRPLEEDEFLRTMVAEGRLLYVFDVHRSYGMY